MMVLFMIGCAFVSYGLLNIGILAGVLLPGDVVLWRSSLSWYPSSGEYGRVTLGLKVVYAFLQNALLLVKHLVQLDSGAEST